MRTTFYFLFILITTTVFAQQFQKTYNTSAVHHWPEELVKTSDGNFIAIGGVCCSGQYHDTQSLIIKINANGDTIWTRKFITDNTNTLTSLTEDKEGNYYVTGMYSHGDRDVILAKLSSTGQMLWSKQIGSDNSTEFAYKIFLTSDNSLLIGGIYRQLIKTDLNGNVLWAKTYDNFGFSTFELAEVSDGYILSGMYYSVPGGIHVMKVDFNGNVAWAKYFGTFTTVNSLLKDKDGNILIVGNHTEYKSEKSNMYLIKLNSSGDTLWTKLYESSDAKDIAECEDGGYIIAGSALYKIDNSGNLLWGKSHSGGHIELTANGYLILGDRSYSLTKTDNAGELGCEDNNVMPKLLKPNWKIDTIAKAQTDLALSTSLLASSISGSGVTPSHGCFSLSSNNSLFTNRFEFYPNPTAGELFLKFKSPDRKDITVIDIYGQTVLSKSATDENVTIDLKSLSNGLYFIEVVDGDKRSSAKITLHQ